MDKKTNYKNYIIIALSSAVVVLFVVVLLLILNKNDIFSFNNGTKKSDVNESTEVKKEDNKKSTSSEKEKNSQDQNTIDNSNSNLNTNTTNNTNNDANNNNNLNNTNSKQNNTTNNNQNSKSEVALLSYFESQANSINENTNQEDVSLREKIKNGFIDIVDFIFYNKPIKGYTFGELTQSAKLKVIKLALAIDTKIEKYFPNYKENIKDKYNDIKGKLAVKYIEVTDSLCKSVGEDTCKQFKDDFSVMKKDFSLAWSLTKELAKDGANKIKQIYENWRDSK